MGTGRKRVKEQEKKVLNIVRNGNSETIARLDWLTYKITLNTTTHLTINTAN